MGIQKPALFEIRYGELSGDTVALALALALATRCYLCFKRRNRTVDEEENKLETYLSECVLFLFCYVVLCVMWERE